MQLIFQGCPGKSGGELGAKLGANPAASSPTTHQLLSQEPSWTQVALGWRELE